MRSIVRPIAHGAVTVAVAATVFGVVLIGTGRLSVITSVVAATGVVYLAVPLVGAAILRTRPRSVTGWIFLTSGTAAAVAGCLDALADLLAHDGRLTAAGWTWAVDQPFALVSVPLMATFGILLFPDRRLDSRRRRVLAWVYGVELVALGVWALLSDEVDIAGVRNPIAVPAADTLTVTILVLGPLSLFACASLLRYAGRETGPHRTALRTAALVSFAVPGAYLACVAAGVTTGSTASVAILENCAAVALGVAAWVGIARYGLFDTRTVLSRALVYGFLSVVLVVVYLLAVAGLDVFFDGLVSQVAAAGAAALAVLPLRELAQRRINQLVYGLRDDPAVAFERLGGRLDAAGAPEDILPAAAETVADALRLRYVAIEAGGEVLSTHGRLDPGPTEELALPFAGETVGRLVVQTRDGLELTRAERQLLVGLTSQVAAAARAVVLTQALLGSRQRLVAAREEERRRLRRDLHDGLGPTLAGIALGIDTVRRAAGFSAPTVELLGTLRKATEAAVGDIRRIVYDLRPPILDELGLAGAVREQALRLGAVDIVVPETLPALPAAVEVAVYRIAVEALTNAARHAAGTAVAVRLSVNGRLELSVADTGPGLPHGYRAGVGLNSMRERAAELGGRCEISRRTPNGTLVAAEFPLEA